MDPTSLKDYQVFIHVNKPFMGRVLFVNYLRVRDRFGLIQSLKHSNICLKWSLGVPFEERRRS